jgi:hypothetical protein
VRKKARLRPHRRVIPCSGRSRPGRVVTHPYQAPHGSLFPVFCITRPGWWMASVDRGACASSGHSHPLDRWRPASTAMGMRIIASGGGQGTTAMTGRRQDPCVARTDRVRHQSVEANGTQGRSFPGKRRKTPRFGPAAAVPLRYGSLSVTIAGKWLKCVHQSSRPRDKYIGPLRRFPREVTDKCREGAVNEAAR